MLSMFLNAAANGQAAAGSTVVPTILMVVVWLVVIYFLLINPQKKQQKELDKVRDSVKPGDNIMTTGGFYGVVLDVVDDTVIVEFGNNKNCRIPMHKNAIAEVEKEEPEETEEN